MQCKACGAGLEPEMEYCPECGAKIEIEEQDVLVETELVDVPDQISDEDFAEEEILPEDKTTAPANKWSKIVKIAVSIIAVAALLCMMVLVIFKDVLVPGHWFSDMPGTIPGNGKSDDVTCQGTYTDSVLALKWKKDTVVAKVGNMELTNGQLQIFYDMVKYGFVQNNSDLTSLNLDLSQPLDRQTCGKDETLSWQQYFLKMALEEWKLYALLCQQAAEADFQPSAEEMNSLNDLYNQFYKSYVATGEYSSVDAVIQERTGLGCDFEDYKTYSYWQMIASTYYNKLLSSCEVTEDLIEAYYQENQEMLEQYNIKKDDGTYLVDVRHILITVKQATNKEEHIEETDWQACEKMAQDILNQWLAGEATEASFAELADKYSSDPGSNTNGGLYTNVQKGEMVTSFDDWCFDALRKVGDYGLVRTEHGYHIMYFSGTEDYWHAVCEAEVPYWQVDLQLGTAVDELQPEISFGKISLWESAYSEK